jgi:hypothetical protein
VVNGCVIGRYGVGERDTSGVGSHVTGVRVNGDGINGYGGSGCAITRYVHCGGTCMGCYVTVQLGDSGLGQYANKLRGHRWRAIGVGGRGYDGYDTGELDRCVQVGVSECGRDWFGFG